MGKKNRWKIDKLMEKGVKITNPHAIEIGEEVEIENISGDGVVIYTGCKIFGASTVILKGVTLGYESSVTIKNCQIAPQVRLAGGFFKDAVFLEGVTMGSGAHVREGTIMEEQSNAAHTVALKQTILFPFVTLGSLINFCDCFMSGGTSRKDHSEVGSSYIHFNYTPHQDKATPSMLGDVPRGVMLDQPPIFLGGQGGMVGPCRIGFGNVIAAGSIFRKDVPESGLLLMEAGRGQGSIPFKKGRYQGIKRIVLNNIIYIANLIALLQWYSFVRYLFISKTFPTALFASLKTKIDMMLHERKKRLRDLCLKMQDSGKIYGECGDLKETPNAILQQQELYEKWPDMIQVLDAGQAFRGDECIRDSFLEIVASGIQSSGKDYIHVIRGLNNHGKALGNRWLEGIVSQITNDAVSVMPLLSGQKSGRFH